MIASPNCEIFNCPIKISKIAGMMLGQGGVTMTRKKSEVEEEHCKEKTVPTMEEPLKLCSACHTSDTPLWRGGPDGPKTLCNACGIRYSKTRRMEFKRAEESKPAAAIFKSEGKSGVEVEELKRRQREKQEKILKVLLGHRSDLKVQWRKWPPASFRGCEDSDEVAEAARLLLSLSSGPSLHS